MLRFLLNCCRRPHVRFAPRRDAHGRLRDPRFVSFMAGCNRRPHESDLRDAVLRGRKVMKNCLKLAVLGSAAWIVLESAKALSVF